MEIDDERNIGKNDNSVRMYFDSLPVTRGGVEADKGAKLITLQDGSGHGTTYHPQDDGDAMSMIGSGSYADYVFRYAAKALFAHIIPNDVLLPWKRVVRGGFQAAAMQAHQRRRVPRGSSAGAHSNMSEVTLFRCEGGKFSLHCEQGSKPAFKVATAYGFKNVQLVLKKVGKQGNGEDIAHDFIEVMACPSGCLNGGGQIRKTADDDRSGGPRRETPGQTRKRVASNLSVMKTITRGKTANSIFPNASLISEVMAGSMNNTPLVPFGTESKKLLHTRFHHVPALQLASGSVAGVALDHTKW